MEETKASTLFKFMTRLVLVLGVSVLGVALYKLGMKQFGDKIKENTEVLFILVVIAIPLLLFLLINFLGIGDSKKGDLQLLLVVSILTIGFVAAFVMFSLKKSPEKKEKNVSAPLLNVIQVSLRYLIMELQFLQMVAELIIQVVGKMKVL